VTPSPPAIRELLADLPRWLAENRATVVKSAAHRAVWRIVLPDGDAVYLKVCRIYSLRSFLRDAFRGPKARLEYDRATALRLRGIPAPEPLAFLRRRRFPPSESYLLTRELAGTMPLTDRLEGELSVSDRFALTLAFAGYFARLHDAGVEHPDPHPGNVLVRGPAGEPEFFLLDLHAVSLGRPLDTIRSHRNLILVNRWFRMRATRTDRARFYREYLRLRPGLVGDARRLEADTEASNRRFWVSRGVRVFGRNRRYAPGRDRRAKTRWHAVSEIDPGFLARLAADPDAPFASRPLLKDSRSSTVVEIEMPTADGPTPAILKRFRIRGAMDLLTNRLRRSKAVRSWYYGHTFADRLLPTPRPWLVLHRRRFGCPAEGYLLCEKFDDAKELQDAVAECETAREVRMLVEGVAGLIRTMHERGIVHRDLKAANVLVSWRDGRPTFSLIDLVGVRACRSVRPTRADRVGNITRLAASFLGSPRVGHSLRLHFLRVYAEAGLRPFADWKEWWREIDAGLKAKVARNARLGRPLA